MDVAADGSSFGIACAEKTFESTLSPLIRARCGPVAEGPWGVICCHA
jgi:hypothetical protein